jgi:acyl-CoA dehydrogenase
VDFASDERTRELCERLATFLDEHVYPAEAVLEHQVAGRAAGMEPPPVIEELKEHARARGLWNLFLPTPSPRGAGLTTLQYAPLAELSGRSPYLAPEAMNCSAPDTGNMEVLELFGSPAQCEQWQRPLLEGRIRSAFAMTEPAVASSDATNIRTSIVRDGDDYVINGHKAWTTGVLSPRCSVLIVMGQTDPDAPRHRRQSMVLVPRDTAGVEVLRPLTVFGYDDGAHGGHGEVVLRNVRVPAANLIGEPGDGFAIAQARLGPGRVHHCMRLVGMAERALELMCTRVRERTAFGRPLADLGVIQGWIADARIRIEMTRLLVLRTAWLIDTVGGKAAAREIHAIKIAAPETATWVIDRAVQAHGAAGLSQDFPLAALWATARSLHFADGPEEVHRMSLARRELAAR